MSPCCRDEWGARKERGDHSVPRVANGMCALFDDGLRCAGGTVIRLATKTAVAGSASHPGGGEPSIRRGLVGAPGTRTYQAWYRDVDASFCTSATFNLANGVETSWSN
jgi:hypothetical protein